jgi:hypothetical protein
MKPVTTYTAASRYGPPAPPPSPSGRWHDACDDSRSETTSTDITTPKDYKISPSFKCYKPDPASASPIRDLVNVVVARSPELAVPISPRSPRYRHKSQLSEPTDYAAASHRPSYEDNTYISNAYAIAPTHAHRYEPYPYSRQRAYSTPMRYYTQEASHYYSQEAGDEHLTPPVIRTQPELYPAPATPYSSPPTPHDRRRAHILSEQKRREAINSGFVELKQRLTSFPVTRALSSCSHQSSEPESESKLLQDSNDLLGGESRDSKAATLRKTDKALGLLAHKVLNLQLQVETLRRELQGSHGEKYVEAKASVDVS